VRFIMIESGQLSEQDELRRKVADLSHELAEREWVSRDQQRRSTMESGICANALNRFTP
jgi:hypothetical protein